MEHSDQLRFMLGKETKNRMNIAVGCDAWTLEWELDLDSDLSILSNFVTDLRHVNYQSKPVHRKYLFSGLVSLGQSGVTTRI